MAREKEPSWVRKSAEALRAVHPADTGEYIEITVRYKGRPGACVSWDGPVSVDCLPSDSCTGKSSPDAGKASVSNGCDTGISEASPEYFTSAEAVVAVVMAGADGGKGFTAREIADKLNGDVEIETITKRIVRMRDKGLAERADTGGYRLTAQGRAALAIQ